MGRRERKNISSREEIFFKQIEEAEIIEDYEKLMKIVMVIGERKATVSSYVETIILNHFDQYQDEINELYKKTFESPI